MRPRPRGSSTRIRIPRSLIPLVGVLPFLRAAGIEEKGVFPFEIVGPMSDVLPAGTIRFSWTHNPGNLAYLVQVVRLETGGRLDLRSSEPPLFPAGNAFLVGPGHISSQAPGPLFFDYEVGEGGDYEFVVQGSDGTINFTDRSNFTITDRRLDPRSLANFLKAGRLGVVRGRELFERSLTWLAE